MRPKLRVEMAFGEDPTSDPSGWSWTDLGTIPDQNLSIRRGGSDESSGPSPSSVSVELFNQDGSLTPDDPRSPHYPNIRRGTPVRVSARLEDSDPWDVRFVGQVSEWNPIWPWGDLSRDGGDGEARMGIVCNGILRRLGQGARPLESPISRAISADPEVLGYWPMEDGAITDRPGSPIEGVGPLGISGTINWATDESLIGSRALPTLTGSVRWVGRVPNASGGWIAEQMVRLPRITTDTTVLMIWLSGFRLRLTISPTSLIVATQMGEGPFVSGPPTEHNIDPTEGWLRFTIDGTSSSSGVWDVYLRRAGSDEIIASTGAAVDFSGYLGTGDIIAAGGRNTDAPLDMAVGHLVVGTSSYVGHPEAEIGWTRETASARFARLCGEESIDVLTVGSSDNSTPMGPQKPATIVELLSACAQAEDGLMGEQTDRPGLTFRTRWSRYNQPVDLTLDASDDEIAEPFAPVLDDQRLRNDITVTRDGGASARAIDEDSIEADGTYDSTITLNLAEDDQTRHHAAWRLHAGIWDQMRYPTVSASFDSAPFALLDLGLGDRLQVTGLPPQHPEAAVDVIIEGTTEAITPTDWRIEANCSPAGIWDVWLVGDPVGSAPLAL